MTRDENIENLKEELKSTLQPVFNQELSLEMWAKIWADEEYDLDLGADEDLSDALEKLGITYDYTQVFQDNTNWIAKMTIFCVVELHGEKIHVQLKVKNGAIECVEVNDTDLSSTIFQNDLARSYAKKVTWAALQ
jgi:hypothetical protein